uniref:Vta1/callose synthase N-terminal domain-containing protein n=1 Tax=Rhizophora mucronata TaxID=61149 RepID=A0A2P2JFL2_RHIMU
MASDNEPGKMLLPYLQRADELQKHEPLVAYYCNSLSLSSHPAKPLFPFSN